MKMNHVALGVLAATNLISVTAATGTATAAEPNDTVNSTFAADARPFPNPERGFYRASPKDLDGLDSAFLSAAYRDGYRLIYARIDLAPFRDGPLPAALLERLSAGFAAARQAGVKIIVRAVYNYPHGETDYRGARDAPLPIVLRHIDQLKPVLRSNVDVIAFVQAGFIGAWGEWHTSSNALAEPAARTAIKDALLAAVPGDRFVQFRYPPYIRQWTGPLPAAGSAGALRTGFHNDCFLASRTDVGTYNEDAAARAAEQDYTDRLGDLAPFGGETCNPADDPGATPRTGCADILSEGARYNLTYLNADYHRPLFHQRWIAEGCYDQVAGRMGYRLRLLNVRHRAHAAQGEKLGLTLTLRNEGWARPFNPRMVEVVLRNRSGAVRRLAAPAIDPRRWLPAADQRVSIDVVVPTDVVPGTYDVLAALPDPSPRLHGDARYAIRFANADNPSRGQGWDEALGAFQLGTSVRVERRSRP